jgi:hypothetical protein
LFCTIKLGRFVDANLEDDMKKTFLTMLVGIAAGVALRPVIERHAPACRKMCEQKMCGLKGCECACHRGTESEDEEKDPLVAQEAA